MITKLPQRLGIALVLGFLALTLSWIQNDQLLRDGDEEGHVGAAELFLQDFHEGDFPKAAHRLFIADMGDYPSLYPALVGTWWYTNGSGLPSDPRIRSINLLFPLLAGLALLVIARDAGRGPALLAGACVLHLPLVAGLSRHFMPEGALVAAVALAVAAASQQRRRPNPRSAMILGLAIGLGLLTKQTFIFYLLPVLWLVQWKPSLLLALPCAALALPWILNNASDQWAYSAASVTQGGSVTLLDHLLFYPRVLASSGLGWAWCGLVLGAAAIAWRSRYRRLVLLGCVWVLGTLVLLTMVPKKYDRLLAPLLPGAAVVIAAGVAARPRLSPFVLVPVAWTTWFSWAPGSVVHTPSTEFQPGCPQVWLRPPDARDPGLNALVSAVKTHQPERLLILGAPEIPCEIQTTFGWGNHVGPYLRRSGVDLPIATEGEPSRSDLLVDFQSGNEQNPVVVELLDTQYFLRRGGE
ncbi:MAG: glycosyltransferase family 39 protein [Myxococcota bacterium]|nr:glycosyltransferase family 39 protein [Myxococcota bacterium]